MSVWYSMDGQIPLRVTEQNRPEIENIVDRFNDESGEIVANFEDETVAVYGGDYMSALRTDDLDGILKELGPHVATPCFISTVYDDERSRLYIGPPEKEMAARSENTLQEVRDLIQHLTPDDKAKLREEL